jgi:hypothetical protein
MSAANNERYELPNPCVIWDGSIDLRNNVEGHYGQIGLHTLKEVRTVILSFWMKNQELPRLRKMHLHCMAHSSVLAKRVV